MYLEAGYDFFDDLTPLGLKEPASRKGAEEAWQRLASFFIEEWRVRP